MRNTYAHVYKLAKVSFFLCWSTIIIAGCSTRCLSEHEVELMALLPKHAVNMAQNEKKISARFVRSFGIFIQKNTVLTVSHALPKNAHLEHFSVQKNDEKNELLLLRSEQCGFPVPLAKKNATINEEVFWCRDGKKAGKIIEENIETYAKFPLGASGKRLTALQKMQGNVQTGDSGRGICNEQGALLGMVVATDTEGAFLIPVAKIIDFLP